MFLNTENFIYCINDEAYEKIKLQLINKKCIIRDFNCISGWGELPKKIIYENGHCVEDCNLTDNYKYEYEGKCYSSCPRGTTSYFNKNNNLVCKNLNEILQNIENEEKTGVQTQEIIEAHTEEIKVDNKINNTLNQFCDPNDFFKNKCIPNQQPQQLQNKDNMITLIKNSIAEGKMNDLLKEVLNNKKDILKSNDNIIYQITTTYNQKNNEYENISTITLDECEDELKRIYNISKNDTLIMFKYDYNISD